MTSNIKVVDINEGAEQEANEAVETIPEEVNNESVIENVVEPTEGVANETIPEPKPELKKKEAPIALEQTQKTNVRQQNVISK